MIKSPQQSTLLACLGNMFLGDDGFGVEVALALASMPLPADVKLVDYGIRGLDLAYALLEPWKSVVLVDAVSRGGTPGTLYLLQPQESAATAAEPALDPHAMDPVCLLAMARSLGEVTAEIYILGCEPQDFGDELEGRMGLSASVQAAIPEAAQMILDLLARLSQNEHVLQIQ
jgi:hydrogenase maturation protease